MVYGALERAELGIAAIGRNITLSDALETLRKDHLSAESGAPKEHHAWEVSAAAGNQK